MWSGRPDLNRRPPAPKAAVLSLESPSFSIVVLKTNELEKYLVVARCAAMWLRMHGVPRILPIAKEHRKCSDRFPFVDKNQTLSSPRKLADSNQAAATRVSSLQLLPRTVQPSEFVCQDQRLRMRGVRFGIPTIILLTLIIRVTSAPTNVWRSLFCRSYSDPMTRSLEKGPES